MLLVEVVESPFVLEVEKVVVVEQVRAEGSACWPRMLSCAVVSRS